jgi:hypothetical protein
MGWLLIPLIFFLTVPLVVALKFLAESRSPFSVIGTALLTIPLIPFWTLMWLTTPLWMFSRCPTCNKRKLVMCWAVRSNPPSPNYYKCDACGARFSHFNGEWSDASSPEYDDRFTSKPKEDRSRHNVA